MAISYCKYMYLSLHSDVILHAGLLNPVMLKTHCNSQDERHVDEIKTGLSRKRQLSTGVDGGNEEMPSSKRGKGVSSVCSCDHDSDAQWDHVAGDRDGHDGVEPMLVKQAVREFLQAAELCKAYVSTQLANTSEHVPSDDSECHMQGMRDDAKQSALKALNGSSRDVPNGNGSVSISGNNYTFNNCVFHGHTPGGLRNDHILNIGLEFRPLEGIDGERPPRKDFSSIPTERTSDPYNPSQIVLQDGSASSNQALPDGDPGATPFDTITSPLSNELYFEVVDQPIGYTTTEELSAKYEDMPIPEAVNVSASGGVSNESTDANIEAIDDKPPENDASTLFTMFGITSSYIASHDEGPRANLEIYVANRLRRGADSPSFDAAAFNKYDESKDDHYPSDTHAWYPGSPSGYGNPDFALTDSPGLSPPSTSTSDGADGESTRMALDVSPHT